MNFEIPDELTKILKLDNAEKNLDLISVIVDPKNKGELISFAALTEDEITKFLTQYFAAPNKLEEFQEVIENNLTFHAKIEALRKVVAKLDPAEANYKSHFDFLRTLKKLRNTAAHSYGVSTDDTSKLSSDAEVSNLLTDFPNNLLPRLTALTNYLETIKMNENSE